MKFEVPIKVDIDDVTKLIHDLQCLQTYKLGVNDTMVLVSLDDIADVFADHIRAKRLDKDIDVPSKEIIHCKDCKFYGRADKRRFYRGSDCLNKRIDTIVPDRDFCSRAEKRGETDE